MDANEIINYIIDSAQANTAGSIAGAFILVILLFWRPKLFFILLGITVVGIGVSHLFNMLASTGL